MSDLGGGLYCKLASEGQRWHIFGVSSIIAQTGEQIFTSVPVYSDWIAKHIGGTEDDEY